MTLFARRLDEDQSVNCHSGNVAAALQAVAIHLVCTAWIFAKVDPMLSAAAVFGATQLVRFGVYFCQTSL